jgi:pantothenate kinase type III
MLLAVDAGNTNVVFALVEGRTIKARWRIATDPRRTADEYAVWLSQLLALEGYERSQIDAVIVATVVPRALHNLQVLSAKYFGTDALVAGRTPVEWGITIDVDEPASLGADRAVNTIAAHASHAGDLIVIDFGTATTSATIAAPTRAASSPPGSTCRSTLWSAPRPSCRASRSRRRRPPASLAAIPSTRWPSASISAISR